MFSIVCACMWAALCMCVVLSSYVHYLEFTESTHLWQLRDPLEENILKVLLHQYAENTFSLDSEILHVGTNLDNINVEDWSFWNNINLFSKYNPSAVHRPSKILSQLTCKTWGLWKCNNSLGLTPVFFISQTSNTG